MPPLNAGSSATVDQRLAAANGAGSSRANPAPVNAETVAGPWKLTVLEAQTGDAATTAVTQASQFNTAPSDGMTFVTVRLRAHNAGDRDYDIEPDDFGVTGSSGVVYRYSQQTPPDPVLHATIKAGETKEGWIVAEVGANEKNLLLIYDSLSITGRWSDAVFALSDGAKIDDATKPAVAKIALGTDLGSPAGIGEQIVTADWAVKLIEVVSGQDVANLFPASDYRTTALLPGDQQLPYWLGLRVQITNVRTGGSSAFLPPTAFLLVTNDGKMVNDVTLLTPPDPDVSGEYFPGASREGWVLYEQPSTYADSIVRFLPFVTDSDPRYLNFGGGSGGGQTAAPPASTVAAGAKVTVTEPVVNLRSEPSTSGNVVAELKQGDVLTVTGPAVAGGDYQWYPVTVDATGKAGYVATNFVTPA